MDDPIHVAACCDDNYMPYAAVMMLSALRATPDSEVHFHLVECGIKSTSVQLLQAAIQAEGGKLSVYTPNDSLYDGLPTHRYGPAVYQRINLPDYLPGDISRVLYIDSDTLVMESLHALWQTDLQGQPVAAVENYSPKACLDINIGREEYFNSGVLLMDLDKWRAEALHEKVNQFARDHAGNLQFVDQCSLNAVLRGRWIRLPAKWNQQSDIYKVITKYAEGCSYSTAELRGAFTAPGIVHFTGKKKPWKVYCFHPFRTVYREMLAQTPWPDTRPPDESLGTRLRYYCSIRKLWKYYRRKSQIIPNIRTSRDHDI